MPQRRRLTIEEALKQPVLTRRKPPPIEEALSRPVLTQPPVTTPTSVTEQIGLGLKGAGQDISDAAYAGYEALREAARGNFAPAKEVAQLIGLGAIQTVSGANPATIGANIGAQQAIVDVERQQAARRQASGDIYYQGQAIERAKLAAEEAKDQSLKAKAIRGATKFGIGALPYVAVGAATGGSIPALAATGGLTSLNSPQNIPVAAALGALPAPAFGKLFRPILSRIRGAVSAAEKLQAKAATTAAKEAPAVVAEAAAGPAAAPQAVPAVAQTDALQSAFAKLGTESPEEISGMIFRANRRGVQKLTAEERRESFDDFKKIVTLTHEEEHALAQVLPEYSYNPVYSAGEKRHISDIPEGATLQPGDIAQGDANFRALTQFFGTQGGEAAPRTAPNIAAEMVPGASMRAPATSAAREAAPPRLSAQIAPERFGVRAGEQYTETVGPRVGDQAAFEVQPPGAGSAPRGAPTEFTGVEPFERDPVQEALFEGARGVPRSVFQAAKDEFLGALGASKTLRSSVDISALFRQGGILFLRPFQARQSGQALMKMFSAFKTRNFDAIDRAIATHPDAPVMNAAGLELPEAAGGLTKGEEAYIKHSGSWIGEKVGNLLGVKQSDQMYNTFIKVLRVNRFLQFKRAIDKLGLSPEEAMDAYKKAAQWVNITTGRGSLGQKIDKSFEALNYALFSPRFVASRLNILNPVMYARNAMTPGGRVVLKGQMSDLMQFLGVVSGIALTARQAGADVSLDYKSPDFLKIKFGNRRYDFGAGVTQALRLAMRVGDDTIRAGAYFATGDKSYKPRPRELATDVAENFLSYKLSPPAALVRDFFKGKTIEGKPFTPARAAASVVVPMQIADFVEAYQQEGFPGLIYSAPGAVGIGYQNYQQPGAVEITPQLGKEFEKHGLKFDTVPTIPGDTEKTQTARAQRVQQWINQYGHELINNSRFQRLDEDQQTSALNNLRRRVMSQANLKNPRLNVFRSSEVIQSVLRSERAEPIRNRRKIVIEAK